MFIFITVFLYSTTSFSQDQKYTRKYSGTVKFQKTEQPATVFEFPYSVSQVEEGLIEFFKTQGSKPKESKGFYFVSSVKLLKDDNRFHDIYYKVEKDGKEASKLYAIVTELGENPVTRTSSHDALVATGAAAGIVAAMGPALDDHDYKMQLEKQEGNIRKTEKKMTSLIDEGKSLEKKKAGIDKEIEVNKQEQQKLQTELDNKKQLYQQFIEKKKNN
jgi:hypothetical protein